MLTIELLQGLLEYDPETGVFLWKVNRRGSVLKGDIAGCEHPNANGKTYVLIGLCGKTHLAHRLAFLAMTGELPATGVDHVDGNGTNNAWKNLRQVSHLENQRNMRRRSDNKSGVTGVSWDSAKRKWRAQIRNNGSQKTLGWFDSVASAADARKNAESQIGFHSNHGTCRPL